MNRTIWIWLAGVILILLLYLGGPAVYFNRVTPTILGMPALYFWFVLVPLLNPLILGGVYLLDKKITGPEWDGNERPEEGGAD